MLLIVVQLASATRKSKKAALDEASWTGWASLEGYRGFDGFTAAVLAEQPIKGERDNPYGGYSIVDFAKSMGKQLPAEAMIVDSSIPNNKGMLIGISPGTLHHAIMRGDLEDVAILLQRRQNGSQRPKPDIETLDTVFKVTPLIAAISNGGGPDGRGGIFDAMVRMLLEHNATVDGHDGGAVPEIKATRPNLLGGTALTRAAWLNRKASLRILLEGGASPDSQDTLDETALIKGSRKGHLQCVRALLKAGASVDHRAANGFTALIEAAWEGHLKTAALLLEYNATVNVQTSYGESALSGSAGNAHATLVELLLKHGADTEAKTTDTLKTPLMVAVSGLGASEGLRLKIVELLLENDADVRARDVDGDDVLALAVQRGYWKVAAALRRAINTQNIQRVVDARGGDADGDYGGDDDPDDGSSVRS